MRNLNSKFVMISSAIFLAVLGIALTFFPQEINDISGLQLLGDSVIILQILGALYIGFAIQNWFVKGSIIGGIYNKPILMGNTLHFMVSSFALVKLCSHVSTLSQSFLVVLTALYVVFAGMFFMLLYFRPNIPSQK